MVGHPSAICVMGLESNPAVTSISSLPWRLPSGRLVQVGRVTQGAQKTFVKEHAVHDVAIAGSSRPHPRELNTP